VDADVGGDVVALGADGRAALPLARQLQLDKHMSADLGTTPGAYVVLALAANVLVAQVLVQQLGRLDKVGAALPPALQQRLAGQAHVGLQLVQRLLRQLGLVEHGRQTVVGRRQEETLAARRTPSFAKTARLNDGFGE
jgi:hypothetical protein